MALIDYVNRSYDVMAFQNVKPAGDTLLEYALFDETTGGTICTGIQKLAQRWLLEFMTETGSMPGLPTRGTRFMTAVRQGRLINTNSVAAAFIVNAYAAVINLQKEETDKWPDDERIANARLLGLAVLPGYANLTIEITSRAGTIRQVILPVATLPEKMP